MSTRRQSSEPHMLRGMCIAFLLAGALSLIAGLCLPFIMRDVCDHPERYEDAPQPTTIIDADLPPLAPEIRPALLMCPICGAPATPAKINLICDHGHTIEHTAAVKSEIRN